MTLAPKTALALHTRRYADGDIVSLADLRESLATAAWAVNIDQQYLPLFQRLEREIAARESRDAVLARVMALTSKGEAPDDAGRGRHNRI
jgi:hypothetical protein